MFHHWFGDLVTAESWSNLTVNESFANYSEYLWNEYKYGKDQADYHQMTDVNMYIHNPTDFKKDLAEFKTLLKDHEKIVAIGECGLDLYHQNISLEKQIALFHAQIEIALCYKKPLIIHSRDAYEQTLKILEEYHKEPLKGVIHCFSYDYDFACTVTDWNFVLGIGGTITYPKNHELRAAIKKINESSLVLETDTPFLPIQSMRGKKNHPQYIAHIAQCIAELKETTFESIATQTTKTAKKLFNI